MLTAKTEYMDKINGLTLGADDYIAKPFNPLELMARVKAQLRRSTKYNEGNRPQEDIIDFGGLFLNRNTHECIYNERELTLTPIEFDILWILCENRGQVISSEQLFEQVWKEKYYKNSNNTVMVHIRHLREKMSGPTGKSDFIKTVWGVGYRVENNYRKLKWSLNIRTVLMAFFSLAVGYIILVVLIDGVLQDSFPAMIISLLMKFGMSQTEADRVYGTVFMQNKGLFVAVGFIILFLIFFYLAMSKVTRYLNSIGTEIETILSNSEAPVTLEPELRPISEKLNTLKMTLKRREYEAVESEQRKNDLVVFLAHDLKTPLTSIIAYLHDAGRTAGAFQEDKKKYIHISLKKSIRLGELISEFFEITRFNLQDIVLQKETLDLSMMLEQLADESYAVLAEKSLTCSIHTDDNLLVDGDPDKLARVFDNLLRNAIAYSYPGTNIDIQAFGEKKDIIITFSNQGDQIPPQKLNFIFEKFYRVDNARQSRTGGAGLGLSIAKEIVELHGGAIAASSSPVCTRFTVKLPRHQEEQQPAAAKKWGRIAKNGGKE